jgi:hypothetical protein
MSVFRALVIAILAAALAMPPLAAAEAHASAARQHSEHSISLDCCPQGQHCDKSNKGDCGQDAQCAQKCADLATAVLAPSAATPFADNQSNGFYAERVALRAAGPSPPPPRT